MLFTEFSIIDTFFKNITTKSDDIICGIGDDAACVSVAPNQQLLISCDTLVQGVHFFLNEDPYNIATKAVAVNVSDIASMGGTPCWALLALTMPRIDSLWLERFSSGLRDACAAYKVALIGGDTTCGPLCITLTIHGLVPKNCAIYRGGAAVGDSIYVSGPLGAASLAVKHYLSNLFNSEEASLVARKLHWPTPRIDLAPILQQFASSCIDISDGLGADLNHICTKSGVGARLNLADIPIHPLVKNYAPSCAFDLAFAGGDDYELCFTIADAKKAEFMRTLQHQNIVCYPIGTITAGSGLIGVTEGDEILLSPKGYKHYE